MSRHRCVVHPEHLTRIQLNLSGSRAPFVLPSSRARSGAFRDVFDVGVGTGKEQVLLGSAMRVVVPKNHIGWPAVDASHLEDRGVAFRCSDGVSTDHELVSDLCLHDVPPSGPDDACGARLWVGLLRSQGLKSRP